MDARVGKVILALSAGGYPTTQFAIRRFGRRGAVAVEVACLGLLVRDAVMIARGTPNMLRPVPAALLRLECATAAVAAATNACLLTAQGPAQRVTARPGEVIELLRRLAIAGTVRPPYLPILDLPAAGPGPPGAWDQAQERGMAKPGRRLEACRRFSETRANRARRAMIAAATTWSRTRRPSGRSTGAAWGDRADPRVLHGGCPDPQPGT
jgi:hypothetical protein